MTKPFQPFVRWTTRRFGLLCMALMVLGGAGTAQAAGWRQCAEEGQVCQLSERGAVRYGTDGQWSSRVMSGAVMCNNDQFGDPAPQSRKRCEVRDSGNFNSGGSGYNNNSSSGNRGWVFCAAEGETCRVRGSAEVRFGTDRQYATRRAYGSVRCDVDSFGDPIYGQTKHCEVQAANAVSGQNPGSNWSGSESANDNARWRYCANEGTVCHVQGAGPHEIRFGDGRRFATRSVRGDAICGTGTFGDPARGVVKHCEVRASSFGGYGDSGPQDGGWTRCAGEGERCEVSGGRIQVRFGTRGRYVYRDAYGGLNCDIATFGSDPYEGQVKQCESRR